MSKAAYKIEVYKSDCRIERPYQFEPNGDHPPQRGEVTEFTYKSRRRLAFVASNTDVRFETMITLTYPREFTTDGAKVKRDLQAMIRWCRHRDELCQYLWFLEFQKRGAPHIHLLLDSAVSVFTPKKDVSGAWYRIVESGDKKHLVAGTRTEKLRSTDGGTKYAVKYAMKMYQKEVPTEYQNVGRFWGHSLGVKPKVKATRYYLSFDRLERDFERWAYNHHLRNFKVSTLYNAAKDLNHER